jgi:hypothetical protein
MAAFLTTTLCGSASLAARPLRAAACEAAISSSTELPSAGKQATPHASGGSPAASWAASACAASGVASGSATSTAAGP